MAELGRRSLVVMPEMFRFSGVGTQSMKMMRLVSSAIVVAASRESPSPESIAGA
jgi:hypothetical protein